MKQRELLDSVKRLKRMAETLGEWEKRLADWQANLEDREQTLKTAFEELKGLRNGRPKIQA